MNYLNEIGHAALACAFAVAVITSVLPLIGYRMRDARLMRVAAPLSNAQFLLVAISFSALVVAFATSDFSVKLVWENSHSDKPFLYKLTGTWGNHEGSMLLWALILVLFAALVARSKSMPEDTRAIVLAVQSWISTAFLSFILVTSNPFARLLQVPLDGKDLNPVLQDIGLAIHPPLLYVGYVGFSVTFSFAIAALILGRIDRAWAKWVRPWALIAWMFLTIGISMGSYWAYYELGWGGFWFWDPVENASLLPWIIGTALLHSAIVVEKRAALRVWTVLLAILTFSLSLLGTFLVRSGVLTSVHAFATDPTRGMYILAILMLFIGGGLALFAWRAQSLSTKGMFEPISREGAIVLNNIFLTALAGTVLFGTLFPLLAEVFGYKLSVGAPFFNDSATPLMVLLAVFVPLGPFLPWKHADARAIFQRLGLIFGAAFLIAFLVWLFTDPAGSLAPIALGVALWLIFGALWEPLWRAKTLQVAPSETLRRLRRLPLRLWGASAAHAGLGVTMLGVVLVTSYATEQIETLSPSDKLTVGGYEVTFEGIEQTIGPNFEADVARLTYTRNGKVAGVLETERRWYETRRMPTTEAAIGTHGFSQIYASVGEVNADGSALIRMYWKPFVTLIWLGSILMFAGGAVSLAGRRARKKQITEMRVTPGAVAANAS